MKGYLINFYKFSHDMKNNIPFSNEFSRSIVWSTFDRLEIRPINSFKEYRLSQFSEKHWLGERQFVMIYEFEDGYNSLVYKKNEKDECKFVFDSIEDA